MIVKVIKVHDWVEITKIVNRPMPVIGACSYKWHYIRDVVLGHRDNKNVTFRLESWGILERIKNSEFTDTRICNWGEISNLINSYCSGKVYSRSYIRDVATGYRANKKLSYVLERLGILRELSLLGKR
jgi:hypothetical protein